MNANDLHRLIGDLVKSEMALIGPSVAVSVARRASGLNVAGNGDVLSLTGDPQTALNELKNAYAAFSPETARLALEHVATKHPDVSL